MRDRYDVLVVGAGHAGTQLAQSLRQRRFAGSIALVGDEACLPYERPPLSKSYLSGEKVYEQILIRPQSFWESQHVDLLLGEAAVRVDAARHEATLQGGAVVGYGKLIWATGGRARRLACEGHALRGVHYIRTRGDVDQLREELTSATKVIVVGAGYIGLESAATLRQQGREVTVLEAMPRVLARVAGEGLSRFYEREHAARGVRIELGATVQCLEGNDGRVSAVRLVDGRTLAADLVIVGIGIVPCVDILEAAGVQLNNGVEVDAQCRTSLQDVFAIGDCASHVCRHAQDMRVRIESIQNATDQALTVSKVLTGADASYDSLPSFWSDQYDLRLQTIGLSQSHDDVVTRGDPESRSFSMVYLRQGRVIALDCVNAPRDFIQGRALVLPHAAPPREALMDAATPLRALV